MGFGAGAGRIDDGGIEAFEFRAHERATKEIALFGGDGFEAAGLARHQLKRRQRQLIAFDSVDRRGAGERQAERTGAGEEIDHAAGIAHGLLYEGKHSCFGFACRLQEAAGAGADVCVADA